jgi:Aldehyde dehydrogenase family
MTMNEMPYAMTIAGKRVLTDASDAAINPATKKPICTFPLATRAHLDQAVAAAQKAFPAPLGTEFTLDMNSILFGRSLRGIIEAVHASERGQVLKAILRP